VSAKDSGGDSTPLVAAQSEIDRLRNALRETVDAYVARLDGELDDVKQKLLKQAGKPKVSSSKMRDVRDMLTLLRNTEIKTEKGRRKDIKRIDTLVGDLQILFERW